MTDRETRIHNLEQASVKVVGYPAPLGDIACGASRSSAEIRRLKELLARTSSLQGAEFSMPLDLEVNGPSVDRFARRHPYRS